MDKTYTAAAIDEACQCAVDLDIATYRAVRIMLKLKGTRYQNKALKAVT